MFKNIFIGFILVLFFITDIFSFNNSYFGDFLPIEKRITELSVPKCNITTDKDIPIVFIPGILASWYSQEGYNNNKKKKWVPDPLLHGYDTLFNTFQSYGYGLKDVYYEDEFNLKIEGNPKKSLYLFGYDWKKDNKITATLLSELIYDIRTKYIEYEGCDIGKVNIIAHSMGGLVVRSMLEDMCVSYSTENNVIIIDGYNNKQKNGKLTYLDSVKCEKEPKIHSLITISTPHRGSPRSLPMWEKGNIERVEDKISSLALKSQLSSKSILNGSDYIYDKKLYERIHGYDIQIPNGIITIGQLLPDINNKTTFNNSLKYLFKNSIKPGINNLDNNNEINYLDNKYYPINSFLEELNSSDSISKMWNKIDQEYISYYSTITENYKKNNLVSFDINDKYLTLYNGYKYETRYQNKDNTYDMNANDIKDIYDMYDSYETRNEKGFYNISESVRNDTGKGGDGTVPTNNLLLVANDKFDGKEVDHNKYKSIELKCYDEDLIQVYGISNHEKIQSVTYENMNSDHFLEACSHTKTPIALSLNLYERISGDIKNTFTDNLMKQKKERKILAEKIGKIDYFKKKEVKDFINSSQGSTIDGQYITNHDYYDNVDELYKNEFERVVSDKEILKDTVNNPINIPLNFGGTIDSLKKYEILSPINITIEDEQGRKIGLDPQTGMIVNEIPGAWTSGDTEGTGEPEFFFIPSSGSGKTVHKIKTYGTGDGEYHIVASDIDLKSSGSGSQESQPLVIAGEARTSFGEDYVVAMTDDIKQYKNLTKSTPTTLEVQSDSFITYEDDFTLRYSIRGNYQEVDRLQYILSEEGKSLQKKRIIDIDGTIQIDTTNLGKYSIELKLLDKEGKVISLPSSQKTINIERIKKPELVSTNNTDDKVKISKEKIKHNYFSVSKDITQVYNNSELKYYLGEDDNIYQINGTKIYKIDKKTKKKSLLYKQSNIIESIFINNSGELYLYDGAFWKYNIKSKKKSLIYTPDTQSIKSFIALDEIIYYLDYKTTGYYSYDIENKYQGYIDTDEYYYALGIDGEGVIFDTADNLKIIDNPVIDNRYKNKLNIISQRIMKKLSQKQKMVLLKQINSRKTLYINNAKTEYQREKIKYILERLSKALN